MQDAKTPSAHTEDVDMTEDEDLIGLEGLYILAMEDAWGRKNLKDIPQKGSYRNDKRVECEYLMYSDPLIN